jgi:predicted RNase H-like HicB family nuclease
MMKNNTFVFTGVIIKENNVFSSICIEIDIASEGLTPEEAKSNLIEAVSLYLESVIENSLSVFRPVPKNESPLYLLFKSINRCCSCFNIITLHPKMLHERNMEVINVGINSC